MNTKRRLNCYVFGNLIVSFLTLNLITNPTSKVLVQRSSESKLNKIYEKEIIAISTPDTIIGSNENTNVIKISNNVSNKETYNYSYVKPSYNSITGNNLVNYAKNFLGLRYVSAGNSLATGTDCSGFTSLIYKEFGITLGRTVASQLYSGTYVSREDLQPGDLVFYSYGSVPSHVTIYIGDGLIIHESNPRDGVKISSINIMRYITARRLITSSTPTSSKEEVVKEQKEISIIENNDNNVINEASQEVEQEVAIVNEENIIQEEETKVEEIVNQEEVDINNNDIEEQVEETEENSENN